MGGISCKAPAVRRPRLRVLVLGLDAAGKTSKQLDELLDMWGANV